MSTSGPSAKALSAILPLIASGQAYEAHQKARTFASRYVKSSQHDTAIDVLFQSARELLKARQLGSGTDLGSFLIEVYDTKGEKVTEKSRARLTLLISLTGPEGAWRKTLIDKSVAWSAKHGSCPAGDPDLRHFVGELLYKDGMFEQAEPQLLAAGKPESARILAQMLFEWSRDGTDAGKYAARGVLPYLATGNVLATRTFLSHFVSLLIAAYPQTLSRPLPLTITDAGNKSAKPDEIFITTDSTLNFLQLIVRTCQRARGPGVKDKQAKEAWVRLSGAYQSRGGPAATPEFRNALLMLGQLYFGLQPPRSQAGNPLQDMMASFLGGPTSRGPAKPTVLSLPMAEADLD